MDSVMNNPRLRVVPVPVEVEGRKMLLFQDPERITEQTVLMPVEAAAIVQFFDGTKSIKDIQQEIMKASGQLIDSTLIQQIVDQLDEHLLLDSPRLHEHMRTLHEKWAQSETRPTSHAGASYPEEKDELVKFLDAFYTDEKGPGAMPGETVADDLKGIIAPHMDIMDSGATTAHAFKTVAERTEAKLFVIFGTAHMEERRVFIMSDKDFETPLGVAKTDRDLVESVKRKMSNKNPINDYIHKDEHSIEFMVVFLQHLFAGKRDFRILPVLVDGISPSIITGEPPEKEPEFRDFMGALKSALDERGEKHCVIAGADLAHLGPRYGDKEGWAPIRMKEEEETDMDMLSPLLSGDRDGFFHKVADIRDKRRVCGLSPIYAAMHATGAARSDLLRWSYWYDSQTRSVVSYASMALY